MNTHAEDRLAETPVVIAAYDDAMEAYNEAIKIYEPGNFMLQEVPAHPEDDIVWLSPFTYARVF